MDNLLTPESVSKETLKETFDAAYLTTSFDEDGDLIVQDKYRAFVVLPESKRWIRFFSLFRANPNSTPAARLAFANMINDKLVLVRAYVSKNGGFGFDYCVWLEGGISKKGVVTALRFYFTILEGLAQYDDEDVLA